jgi:hypothetical protein
MEVPPDERNWTFPHFGESVLPSAMRILGVLLIALGALGLAYKSVPYTTREKVLEIGPVSASAEMKKELEVPPLVSGAVLGVGVILLLVGGGKRRR